ncbi:MAG TPA: adenylate/guanylate cyclase domain-containing protein [Bacteroidia bacterium]|nr:adenylate/guanylate cyclase domain-containing protein [Bacteroidia bacterium]
MKFKLFTGFILFLAFAMNAQDAHTLDSLKKLLHTNPPDTSRVQILLAVAEEIYFSDPALAMKECEQAKILSERINYTTGLSNSLGWLAYLNEQQGEIKKALDYYRQALIIFEKAGDKKSAGTCLNNIAAIYKDQGQIEPALAYHERSLAIKKEIGDEDGIATSYNNIGLIYSSQGRIPEALDYYMKALAIEEKVKNMEGVSTALQNIGHVYKSQQQYDEALTFFRRSLSIQQVSGDKYGIAYSLNALGIVKEEQNEPDSALYFYEQAMHIRTDLGDQQGVAHSLKNIGIVKESQGQSELARDYFKRSLHGFENLGDKWGIAMATSQLGVSLLAAGDSKSAQPILERSLSIAKELGYPADIRNAAGSLSKLYRQNQSWKQALEMSDLFVRMRDSVQNDNNRKASMQTRFRYEYEKKEAVLRSEQEKKGAIAGAELKRQKQLRNGFIAGFGIVLVFAGIVLVQRNRIRKGKKRSDELLHNILPEEVAEELKQKGHAEAKQFNDVTVMFTDFKSFTSIAEKFSPAELVKEIDTIFQAFDHIVEKYKIEKIKTIGDSYMCAGGLPVPNSTHPAQMVRAGLEMLAFIAKNKDEKEKLSLPAFELRIGIHTGPVVAGIVGVKKFAYDIWGDTVNTASRMENGSEPGKLNISGSTFALIKDQFRCTFRGKLPAKNKGDIEMYFVEKEYSSTPPEGN